MTDSLPIFAGILASMLHVISGPDHLAAVAPITLETKKTPWKIGTFWGLGHVVGMLLIGGIFLAFKEYIPVGAISKHSEELVGIVLIGIGFWAFYRIFKPSKHHNHPHVHTNGETFVHIHEHEHQDNKKNKHTHPKKIKQNFLSAFGVGVLHGLAGVSHFLLLLPVLGFKNDASGLQYLIGFAIGTIFAMTAFALVIGQIAKFSKNGPNKLFFKGIRFAGGLFAFVIGTYWLVEGGF